MSKKENITETPEQDKKVVTRYDRRMQKRKEQEEKRKKEQKITAAIGAVILAAAVALIISFPIRSYLAVNRTFVKINGDKVTRVEFDYNYNTVVNDYYNQMGAFAAYMGLDFSRDLSLQMYSDTLTWQDYFQQTTVQNIQTSKSLVREAKAAGFTEDTDEGWKEFQENIKARAAEAGMSTEDFLRSVYGSYATMNRLERYVRDGLVATAYYNEVADGKTPSDEDIQAHYEENKDLYDSIDYRAVQVDAELPTEPTELADPQPEEEEETEDAAAEDGEEEAYEPSQAEIDAAMEIAHDKAVEAEKTISEDVELTVGAGYTSLNFNYSDWLLDEARKPGDTTIVENEASHRYYVVEFVDRYRSEEATVKARVITVTSQEALDNVKSAWESGEASEERFTELYHEYSEDSDNVEDGLYEGISEDQVDEAMGEWLFAEERSAGDVQDITTEDGVSYLMYYVGTGEPEWYYEIRSTLLNDAMSEYLAQITEGSTVEDPKENLRYLLVEAAMQAESAEDTGSTDETDSTGSTEAADSTESGGGADADTVAGEGSEDN